MEGVAVDAMTMAVDITPLLVDDATLSEADLIVMATGATVTAMSAPPASLPWPVLPVVSRPIERMSLPASITGCIEGLLWVFSGDHQVINPAFLTCAVCGRPNSSPFRFKLSATSRAQREADAVKRAAEVNRHEEEQRRGSGGPQFTWSPSSEALLCDEHRDRIRELGLLEVPMEEALSRLREDAGHLPRSRQSDTPSHDADHQQMTSRWWSRCLRWWRRR